MLRHRLVLITVVSLAALCPGVSQAASRFPATPATEYNAYFTRCGPGWNAGDSGFSFALRGPLAGRTAWFWSDTFLGEVKTGPDGEGRRELTSFGIPPFIHNSMTLQPSLVPPVEGESPEDFVTLYGALPGAEAERVPSFPGGGDGARPVSPRCAETQRSYRSLIRPAEGEGAGLPFYWAGDGLVRPSGQLQVVMRKMLGGREGLSSLNFAGNAVATLTPTVTGSMRLDGLTPVPAQSVGISWGASILKRGRVAYVYGVATDTRRKRTRLYVARVGRDQLAQASAWRYWDGRRFGRSQGRARSIGAGTDFEFTAVTLGRRVAIVSADFKDGYTRNRYIRAWTARTPVGPFRPGPVVYRVPENQPGNGVLSYAAHLHPHLKTEAGWLLSYSLLGPDHLVRATQYGPRFVRIRGLERLGRASGAG